MLHDILYITHLYPRYEGDHYGSFIHNHVKAIASKGRSVVVVSPVVLHNKKGAKHKRKILDGVQVYYPTFFQFPTNRFKAVNVILFTIQSVLYCLANYRLVRARLIHSHFLLPDGFVCLFISKLFNSPSVCTLRGSDVNVIPKKSRFLRRLSELTLRRTDRVAAVSESLASASLVKKNCNCKVIYNGCDIDSLMSVEVHEFEPQQKNQYLLFVGNIIKSKGVYELIGILDTVIKQYPDTHLLLVGDGPEIPKLRTLVYEMNLDSRVLFLGKRKPEEVKFLMERADVFIFPSHREGLPNVVLEAARMKMPIVASRVGGIPEILSDQETGLLFSPMDVEGFSKSVVELLRSDFVRSTIGRKAYEASLTFSWDANADIHCEMYDRLLREDS